MTELIDHVGLSQPLVSWHLARLRLAGIVQTRRNGRETVCMLRAETFDEVSARERVLFGLPGRTQAIEASPGERSTGGSDLERAESGA